MTLGTWQGVLMWCLVVGAFYAGTRWGRARERFEKLRDEARRLHRD